MSAFSQIIQFALTSAYEPDEFLFRAQTRNDISSRLLNWANLLKQNGFSDNTAFLLVAVLGEIANNAFDHNLGQGIVNSLKAVQPQVQKPVDYLTMAFEKVISGRAPEQRGNGLKFVRKNFQKENAFELVCISSGLKYKLGSQNLLETALGPVSAFQGTIVAIDWKREGK